MKERPLDDGDRAIRTLLSWVLQDEKEHEYPRIEGLPPIDSVRIEPVPGDTLVVTFCKPHQKRRLTIKLIPETTE